LLEPWAGGDEHVAVRIHDVPSDERAIVEHALLATALPDLVRWLREASTAREGWRMLRHSRTWRWLEGELVSGRDE
jgi:hypothetical protein